MIVNESLMNNEEKGGGGGGEGGEGGEGGGGREGAIGIAFMGTRAARTMYYAVRKFLQVEQLWHSISIVLKL